MLILCFVCGLLVVSKAAVCGCLGQKDFVGFVLSFQGLELSHMSSPKLDAAVNLPGKILLRWSEDSVES